MVQQLKNVVSVTKYSCITVYIVTKYSCIIVYIVTKYSCITVYIVTKYSCITVYIVTKYSCITVYIYFVDIIKYYVSYKKNNYWLYLDQIYILKNNLTYYTKIRTVFQIKESSVMIRFF